MTKKRVALLVIAAAMVVGVTACKKEAATTTAEATSTEEVTTEATTEEVTEDTEATTEGPAADEGFGKSNADATGVVDFDTLKATFQWADEVKFTEHPTYEEFKEHFGVDGEPWRDTSSSFTTARHYYKWLTEDGNSFYYVGFNVNDDGSETYFGDTYSSDMKD